MINILDNIGHKQNENNIQSNNNGLEENENTEEDNKKIYEYMSLEDNNEEEENFYFE